MFILKLSLFLNLIFILILGIYPLYAWLKSAIFKNPIRKSSDFLKPVSIIIASYNEENTIRQKLESFLNKDEWIEGSEIVVVSGGSTDLTDSVLSEFQHNPFVRIFIEEEQLSKIRAVNLAVSKSKHELLVFSDCRQVMEKGSVKQLIRNFNDPVVGTVTATLLDSGKHGRLSFRNLLNFTALCESQSGSCLNVFGALYAQRKSVFRNFPTGILFDDLFVVVSTVLQKKRLIMEKNAILYDVPFRNYYMPDRIHRLTRGLLIFLREQYRMIFKLPLTTLLRFLIFKYFKLILPFVFLLSGIELVILSYHFLPFKYLFVPFLTICLLFITKPIRQLTFHFIKINYHFLVATLQFVFFNKKSNRWEKLALKNQMNGIN